MPTFYHLCHVYGNGDAVGKVIFRAVIIALVLKANFTMMNSKSITRRYNSSDREAMCVCVCVVIISSIIIHSELLGELIGLTMNGFDIVVSA